jgi:putative mRNA 3-end processing factor
VRASECSRVIVTHGDEAVLVRALGEMGLQCGTFRTKFGSEAEPDAPGSLVDDRATNA